MNQRRFLRITRTLTRKQNAPRFARCQIYNLNQRRDANESENCGCQMAISASKTGEMNTFFLLLLVVGMFLLVVGMFFIDHRLLRLTKLNGEIAEHLRAMRAASEPQIKF